MSEIMDHINARARFQHVADEIASMVPHGVLREVAYQLAVLQQKGLPISVAVEAFQEASDKKAKR